MSIRSDNFWLTILGAIGLTVGIAAVSISVVLLYAVLQGK
jgi:hypothetical protein